MRSLKSFKVGLGATYYDTPRSSNSDLLFNAFFKNRNLVGNNSSLRMF